MTAVIDVSGNPWTWARFDDAKPHAVHRSLVEGLIVDMEGRGCTIEAAEGIDSISFDLPGPIIIGAPQRTFKVDLLKIEIPCDDVPVIYSKLCDLPARHFYDGSEYYKLHGFLRCLVMTPQQKEMLEALTWAAADECVTRADEFFDGWKQRNKSRSERS